MDSIYKSSPVNPAAPINQLSTTTPADLLGRFERQFNAPKEIHDVVDYGTNKYNDTSYALLNLVFKTAADDSKDTGAKRAELVGFNQAVYTALHTENGKTTIYFGTDALTLAVTEHDYGVRLEIEGGYTKYLFGVTKAEVKELLEQRTTSVGFDRGFLRAELLNENPVRFMEILALSKTIAGVPIHTTHVDPSNGKKSADKNWVIPGVTQQPSHIPCVSVHAGSSFIGRENKKPLDENSCIQSSDATTFAYVAGDGEQCRSKFVMVTLDGCNYTASAENSRLHSALISTAAVQTAQELENGTITEKQLKDRFNERIKALYKVALQNNPNFMEDEATFAGGVLFDSGLADANKLKLFSFHIGDTVLAVKKRNNAVVTLHGTDASATFMKGPNNNKNDNMLAVQISDVNILSEIKMGTDGIGPLHFEPSNLHQGEVKNIQCKNNFPPHGEFDSSLTSKIVTREALREKEVELSTADLVFEMYKPTLKLCETVFSGSGVSWEVLATDEGQRQHGSKFHMPEQQLVQLTIKKLDKLAQLQSELNAKSESMMRLKKLTFEELSKVSDNSEWINNETAQLTREICWEYIVEQDMISGISNPLEARTISSLITSILFAENNKVSKWNAIMGTADNDNASWKALADDKGRAKYADKFIPPSKSQVEPIPRSSAELESIGHEIRDLNGDDVMFVSVEIHAIQREFMAKKVH